jgi:hypothetical protein
MITPVYKSQWGKGATARVNDCGPASVAGFLEAIGDFTPIDQLRTGEPTGLTTADDLVRIFAEHGVEAHTEKVERLEDVKQNSILLVSYDPLRKYAQDINFRGLHWLTLLRIGADYVETHDPDHGVRGLPASEGAFKRYPLSAMRAALKGTAVVVDGLMPMPEPTRITGIPYRVIGDVNYRQHYSITAPAIRSLSVGQVVIGYDRAYRNGKYLWRMVEHSGTIGWVADDYLKAVS